MAKQVHIRAHWTWQGSHVDDAITANVDNLSDRRNIADARLIYEGNRNVRIAKRRDHLESSRHQIAELEHKESREAVKVVRPEVNNLIIVSC